MNGLRDQLCESLAQQSLTVKVRALVTVQTATKSHPYVPIKKRFASVLRSGTSQDAYQSTAWCRSAQREGNRPGKLSENTWHRPVSAADKGTQVLTYGGLRFTATYQY